ncbi:MAG: aldo/keto reductase, partial [Pseudomonadota bacterium]|nr:aldo/keto reductase [Pseudomonadota bacterium]
LKSSKIESDKISLSDSYGNTVCLDRWRKKTGVIYDYDKPENKSSSFSKTFPYKKESLIPKQKIKGLDIKASRLVFGCDNQLDVNHAFTMFDHFFSLGGNVFDTAYIYNSGKSDENLGRWLNSRKLKDEVIILGKGAHTPDCYPESIRPQLLETLSRLNLDCLDIYCLHRDNYEIPVGEFIDVLDELRSEGLIKIYGASNWSLNRFKESFDYSKANSKNPFSILSNNFSLAEMIEPVWPGCESCWDESYREFLTKENIPIFPWSSQARGFFLKDNEVKASYHPANPDRAEQDRVWFDDKNLKRRERCFTMAEEKGFEPIEVALAYVLNQSFPTFPLIGPRNLFETESSVKSLEINLSHEDIRWLEYK